MLDMRRVLKAVDVESTNTVVSESLVIHVGLRMAH